MKELVCNAFWTALLLTGDAAKAEELVQTAIEYLDADELSSNALPMFVSALALQLGSDESVVPGGDALVLAALPNELRNVIRLPRLKRQCFVLRILLGYTEGRCARLLHVRTRAIFEEVGAAMSELASMSVTNSWPGSPEEYCLQIFAQRPANPSYAPQGFASIMPPL